MKRKDGSKTATKGSARQLGEQEWKLISRNTTDPKKSETPSLGKPPNSRGAGSDSYLNQKGETTGGNNWYHISYLLRETRESQKKRQDLFMNWKVAKD